MHEIEIMSLWFSGSSILFPGLALTNLEKV
jgi:hypothetical protein